jgi:hypothetical protein
MSDRYILKNGNTLGAKDISIINMYPASTSEWDTIWEGCDYSTFFHSREWIEIWRSYTKGKLTPRPLLVNFSDGKKALLPFSCTIEQGIKPILMGTRRQYVSSPECTYGGWISTDILEIAHVTSLLKLIKREFSNLVWRVNPFDKLALESCCGMADKACTIDNLGETHAINLEKGFEQISNNMARDHKRAVKKALQNQIYIKMASSIEDWQEYYRVYENTLNRWGNRLLGEKYLWSFFEEIYKRKSKNVELLLAIYKERAISGALFFKSKNHIDDWHSAALEMYLNLKPVNLLLYEAIKYACEKHYTWFDFNPSAGLQGVKSFKEGFGAQALRCPIVNMRTRNKGNLAIGKVCALIVEVKKQLNCS